MMKKRDCPQNYRIDFLKDLPKNCICAEIGVHKGEWSKKIIEITKPKELWLIDHWLCSDPNDSRFRVFLNNVFDFYKDTKLIIKKGFLEDLEIPYDYFDWVYLDTEHSYENTIKELPICFNMLKNGGLLTGDDYGKFPTASEYEKKVWKGLTKGVDDFVKSYSDSIQIDYLNKKEINNSKQFKIIKKI